MDGTSANGGPRVGSRHVEAVSATRRLRAGVEVVSGSLHCVEAKGRRLGMPAVGVEAAPDLRGSEGAWSGERRLGGRELEAGGAGVKGSSGFGARQAVGGRRRGRGQDAGVGGSQRAGSDNLRWKDVRGGRLRGTACGCWS